MCGNLTVTAGGNITQSGALTVGGASSFNAGANSITLGNAGNDFGGAVTLTGGATQIKDGNALTLGTLSTGALTVEANAGGGTADLNLGKGTVASLDAKSNGGAIKQSTAVGDTLTVTGTSTVNAGTGDITLAQAGNDFGGAVTLTTVGAGNATVSDTNTLALAASGVGGNLTVTAGGNITQNGALTVGGVTTLALTASGSDILLASQPNNFAGGVALGGTVANIRDIELRSISASAATPSGFPASGLRNVTLAFDNAALALPAIGLTGTLTVKAGGNITQSGALTVGGASSFNAGVNSITLGNAGNDFGGAVTLTTAGAGNATVSDTNTLALAASGVGGNLTVTAGGNIT
ncbi:MAG: beta strand repeat-containing protein, partial [Betaproteobacteria bacterium]